MPSYHSTSWLKPDIIWDIPDQAIIRKEENILSCLEKLAFVLFLVLCYLANIGQKFFQKADIII